MEGTFSRLPPVGRSVIPKFERFESIMSRTRFQANSPLPKFKGLGIRHATSSIINISIFFINNPKINEGKVIGGNLTTN